MHQNVKCTPRGFENRQAKKPNTDLACGGDVTCVDVKRLHLYVCIYGSVSKGWSLWCLNFYGDLKVTFIFCSGSKCIKESLFMLRDCYTGAYCRKLFCSLTVSFRQGVSSDCLKIQAWALFDFSVRAVRLHKSYVFKLLNGV